MSANSRWDLIQGLKEKSPGWKTLILERSAKGITQFHRHCYTFKWVYALTFTIHAQMILNPSALRLVARLQLTR